MKLILLFLVSTMALADTNPAKTLEAANQAFDAGNYAEAVTGYRSLLGEGHDSGDIHFNLGNAYFREKALGLALFHYRKASELRPRDPEIRFNLAYARNLGVDKIEEKGLFVPRLLPFSAKEALRLVGVASLLFWALAILQLFKPRAWSLWARNLSLVLFLFAGVVAAQSWLLKSPFGVVTAEETEVFSGPGKDRTVLFKLHGGTEFTLSDASEPGWARISLPDGKKGWVKKQDVAI